MLLVFSLPYLIPPIPKTKLGWLALLVLGPLGYLFGEWLGEKFSGPWGESNLLLSALKATGLITFVLMAMIMWVLFTAR